jgi:hypothetical protein
MSPYELSNGANLCRLPIGGLRVDPPVDTQTALTVGPHCLLSGILVGVFGRSSFGYIPTYPRACRRAGPWFDRLTRRGNRDRSS